LASPPNPSFDPLLPGDSGEPGRELAPGGIHHPISASRTPDENPAWSGWEVFALAGVTLATIFVFLLATTFVAHQFIFPKVSLQELAKYPGLVVVSQLLAYVVVLGFMYLLVVRESGQNFWKSVRWNFPRNWRAYLFAGVLLSIGLQLFAHLLPIPKNLPMDQFFQTTNEAYLLSIFGVTFAPLLEELFFRGFLYPVLARRTGMAVGVLLTAVAFALLHGAQLSFSWGPVLVIFIVGLVLSLVRALTKSVAAGLLIHIAYNGTLSFIMFVATGGFRHLERLNQ